MKFTTKLHMLHRFWRYRLRSERSSLAFLLRQNLKGSVVLDVGANLGIYSYWMSRAVGPSGRVVAFEPQPELIPHLHDLRSAFGLVNLEIVARGLSSASGIRILHRPKVGAGGATVEEQVPSDWKTVTVDVTALDDYYTDPRPVRFIKCDVERHEYPVLLGAKRILARDHPTLLVEMLDDEARKGDIPRFLNELGYDGFFFHHRQKIEIARFSQFPYRKPTEHHRNYMFVARD